MYDFIDYVTGEKLSTMIDGSWHEAKEEKGRLEYEYDIVVSVIEY